MEGERLSWLRAARFLGREADSPTRRAAHWPDALLSRLCGLPGSLPPMAPWRRSRTLFKAAALPAYWGLSTLLLTAGLHSHARYIVREQKACRRAHVSIPGPSPSTTRTLAECQDPFFCARVFFLFDMADGRPFQARTEDKPTTRRPSLMR